MEGHPGRSRGHGTRLRACGHQGPTCQDAADLWPSQNCNWGLLNSPASWSHPPAHKCLQRKVTLDPAMAAGGGSGSPCPRVEVLGGHPCWGSGSREAELGQPAWRRCSAPPYLGLSPELARTASCECGPAGGPAPHAATESALPPGGCCSFSPLRPPGTRSRKPKSQHHGQLVCPCKRPELPEASPEEEALMVPEACRTVSQLILFSEITQSQVFLYSSIKTA
ncbi:uncharacterized protein LOC115892653 [Rhinopithecus roxellana]|uniref:uncharacterized protein LOC115892653 n=1 Tax=Rhinopithecus roxellana TaxID=61622 RepID=UPI0012372152|nr:uncharacterized protein LOC115892653 [Rhinopithecus roxellana]